MDGSAFLTTTLALGAVLLLMFGLAFIIRRLNLLPAIKRATGSRGTPDQALSCRIGRGCTLSIITLDGVRFAILNGPRSDQMKILSDREMKIEP